MYRIKGVKNGYTNNFENAPPPQERRLIRLTDLYVKNFRAFTLAEVLITLGIIGVVASLTLPVLVANYKKQVTVTQLKKAYTEISQAVKLSELQNGDTSDWDFTLSGTDFYYKYLQTYFIKNKELQNREFKKEYTVNNLNGTKCTSEVWCTKQDSFYIYLSNGSIMGIMTHDGQSKYKSVTIDINGFKKPNQLGKDFFVFSIISPDGLVPYGYKDGGINGGKYDTLDRNKLKSTAEYACNAKSKGIWCSALIMADGWEIKDDYPW